MTEDPGGKQKLVRELVGVGTEGGWVEDAVPPVLCLLGGMKRILP